MGGLSLCFSPLRLCSRGLGNACGIAKEGAGLLWGACQAVGFPSVIFTFIWGAHTTGIVFAAPSLPGYAPNIHSAWESFRKACALQGT